MGRVRERRQRGGVKRKEEEVGQGEHERSERLSWEMNTFFSKEINFHLVVVLCLTFN